MALKLVAVSSEELAEVYANVPNAELTEYAAFINTLDVGAGFRVDKDENTTDRALKRRINQAAKSVGRDLEWAEKNGYFFPRVKAVEIKSTEEAAEKPAKNGKTAAQ